MTNITLIYKQSWQICTPDDLRTYLRLDDGVTDELLTYYLEVAVDLFENATRKTIQEGHYRFECPQRPAGYRLPHQNVTQITLVKIGEKIIPSDQYGLDDGYLYMSHEGTQNVTIEYKAGYPDEQSMNISLKHILMICAADLYLYRLESETNLNQFSRRILGLVAGFNEKRV